MIIELRESAGLNRKGFCKPVDIPYRTMTGRELDRCPEPDCVRRTLEYYLSS